MHVLVIAMIEAREMDPLSLNKSADLPPEKKFTLPQPHYPL